MKNKNKIDKLLQMNAFKFCCFYLAIVRSTAIC
jgi:hypothetical protein